MNHFLAVHGLQALRGLLHDAAHRVERRGRVVDHPLRQRLSRQVFHRHEQMLPRPNRGGRLHHMGAVDAAGDPLLQHEAVERLGLSGKVHRRCLDRHRLPGLGIERKVDATSRAGMQLANDRVPLEFHARLQGRWQRQAFTVLVQHVGIGLRQRLDSHQLNGRVVGAAARLRGSDQRPGGTVEVIGVRRERGMQGGGVQVLVGAVRGEQVDLARLQLPCEVVDVDAAVDAERTPEKRSAAIAADAVVLGQLFECMRMQSVDARVAHVQQVRVAPLQHERAEGADAAQVLVEAAVAALRLRVQPCIRRLQHAPRRAADRPGLRGGVVVLQEPAHRRGTRDMADPAAADAVGQRDGDALGRQLGAARQHGAVEVLIRDLADARLRVLADADGQHAGFRLLRAWPSMGARSRRRAGAPSCSAWSKASRPRR